MVADAGGSVLALAPGVGTCMILAKNGVSENRNDLLRLTDDRGSLERPPLIFIHWVYQEFNIVQSVAFG